MAGSGGRGSGWGPTHVTSSKVSNWQTFESHFTKHIKRKSAQKLLQNIRITFHIENISISIFLLLFLFCALSFVYLHSQFRARAGVFPIYFAALEAISTFTRITTLRNEYQFNFI